jgi:phospho-N-acetylmuramoyl-pentapeptide-transferase
MNSIVIITILVAFFLSIIMGTILIPVLRSLGFVHHIKKEEPLNHQKKGGTPTLGGIIFLLATTLTMLFIDKSIFSEGMIALYSFIGFGIIGFIDDGLKLFNKRNLGLRAYQKMVILIVISSILSYYICIVLNNGTVIIVPFLRKAIDLGKWYFPFIIFYFAATTNGGNLTDGLDGLAATIGLLIMTFFSLLSFSLGHYSLSIFCAATVGSILGFLKFNMFPAKIFMGDTGSLAIGGAIATVAMLLKLPLIILLVGFIYVIETLSDVLQVSYYKLRRKRIFKMAPIHYHFELMGWSETKIISVFSILTVIFCFIGFLSL